VTTCIAECFTVSNRFRCEETFQKEHILLVNTPCLHCTAFGYWPEQRPNNQGHFDSSVTGGSWESLLHESRRAARRFVLQDVTDLWWALNSKSGSIKSYSSCTNYADYSV
jgi:hypothetical protein